MKNLGLILLCFVLPTYAQAQPIDGKDVAVAAAKCQSCHDAPGQNAIPRLNGQQPAYILTRLREFHNPASQAPHATYAMFDMASATGAHMAEALAGFFSRQVPAPAHSTGPLAAKGKLLFESGAAAGTNCQACHGKEGRAAARIHGWRASIISISASNWTASG